MRWNNKVLLCAAVLLAAVSLALAAGEEKKPEVALARLGSSAARCAFRMHRRVLEVHAPPCSRGDTIWQDDKRETSTTPSSNKRRRYEEADEVPCCCSCFGCLPLICR